ncbi:transglycosylase SLT domain-containing protein [Evansella sp. AB-P1]|uniref:transglycosylase SLT domain-containing protein n=1 Tax=Evansella sp. AB-P1 TaxID=3037653 RepID=UPI00241EE126|nr:transglycosylase SLT domain-containing protein [Evansella sp. AB-P1]MDG5788776.1 transglycosylase SLT domain-containing protein [Evansella sp. AB-P1]
MQTQTKILYIALIAITFFFIVMGNEYQKIVNDKAELENEMELVQKNIEEVLDLEDIQKYVDALSQEADFSVGLTTWMNGMEIANTLYEDSKGQFEEEWGLFLSLEAENRGIDPFLVYELLKIETGGTFDPTLVGPETPYGHAYGLAQFMENTGPWVANMANLEYEHDLLFDPLYSIQLSLVYLEFLYDLYEDWNYALTAYHRGIYGLEMYIEENGHAESWYAVEIQENAEEHNSLLTLDH